MSSATCLRLSLPAVPASVRSAREAVAEAAGELLWNRRLADVRLCVSEAVSNVVRHAYGGPGSGDVEVVVERDTHELEIVVRDYGRGLARSRRNSGLGGNGMKIIDTLADRWVVESGPRAGTELRMVFDLRTRSH